MGGVEDEYDQNTLHVYESLKEFTDSYIVDLKYS